MAVVLPQSVPTSAAPPVTGKTWICGAFADLTAAIAGAVGGDQIVLTAGATFGAISLPAKSGTGWISIVSSALASLPAGKRVAPSDAGKMPKLIAASSILSIPGARWYVAGVEITSNATAAQTSLVNLTGSNIILDRCYIHGTATLDLRRCVTLNSGATAIVNCYIDDAHSMTYDAQAVLGWNGTGPYLLDNCFFAGSGENVMFGGADPTTSGQVPSDITITNNLFSKPTTWKGKWLIKNLLEFKIGNRVLVDSNEFTGCWPDLEDGGQDGYAISFKTANQDGKAAWSQTSNVTFSNNVIHDVSCGIKLMAIDSSTAKIATNNILIKGNLFHDMGGNSTMPRLFLILGNNSLPLHDITIDHNTCLFGAGAGTDSTAVWIDSGTVKALVVTTNVLSDGAYGVKSSGKASGDASLAAFSSDAVFTGNVMIGTTAGTYTAHPGNFFPASLALNADYTLPNPATYGNAGYTPPTVIPSITITTPSSASTGNMTISGTTTGVAAGAIVTLYNSGANAMTPTAVVAADGSWSSATGLGWHGGRPVTAQVVDTAGDTLTSAPVTFYNEITLPKPTITTTGGTVTSATIALAGGLDHWDWYKPLVIYANGAQIGSYSMPADAYSWSTTATLPGPGTWAVTVTQTNLAGAGTSNAVTFTL